MDKNNQQKSNNDVEKKAMSTPIQSLKPQEKPNNPELERQDNNQTSEQDNDKKN